MTSGCFQRTCVTGSAVLCGRPSLAVRSPSPNHSRGLAVLEVVDDYDGDTYRAVYTVRFAGVVYVLHAFQKKSKRESTTPRQEIALIRQRLQRAREDYAQWVREQ